MCFFNDTATTEIYTLSLHDALPICVLELGADPAAVLEEAGVLGGHDRVDHVRRDLLVRDEVGVVRPQRERHQLDQDRKSTRLNSSHANISYAVFCLKKTQHDLPLAL